MRNTIGFWVLLSAIAILCGPESEAATKIDFVVWAFILGQCAALPVLTGGVFGNMLGSTCCPRSSLGSTTKSALSGSTLGG